MRDNLIAMIAVKNAVGESEVTSNKIQVVSYLIEVYRKIIATTDKLRFDVTQWLKLPSDQA